MKINMILVPTDFSVHSDKAIDMAVALAQDSGASIKLVHAYPVAVPYTDPQFGGGIALPDGYNEQVRDAAKAKVEAAAKAVAERGVKADGVSRPGPASSAILAETERLQPDLIVMGTRGLSGLKHVVLGSVAERTIRLAPCPVLTVKAAD
jgi:nucleotide-binding universal stress UspA family protein